MERKLQAISSGVTVGFELVVGLPVALVGTWDGAWDGTWVGASVITS